MSTTPHRMTLLHGTRRPFQRGGLLLPRSEHRGPGTTAPLNPGKQEPADAAQWVYLTTDLRLAWVYAWHAPGRGRPRVLTVAPLGEVEADDEHSAAMAAFRCQAAKVVAVDLSPVLDEEEARAGWVLGGAR